MKIDTETVTLPAHWASALINGDYSGCTNAEKHEIDTWVKFNPHLSIVSCSDNPELHIFEGYLCETLEYACHVRYFETRGNGLHYLIYPVSPVMDLLPWQKRGLTYTATGYGKKIPTSNVVYLRNRKYRIYCTTYSNIGTCWIDFDGHQLIVD